MALIYKMQKDVKAMKDANFSTDALFFETDKYIEIGGKVHSRETLSEEKSSRMPRLGYSSPYNQDNINTISRTYSKNYDGRVTGGLLPFRSEDTILRNSVVFNDGTEIVAADNPGDSFSALYQYRFGEIMNLRRINNNLGKILFVKVDEGSFIALRNTANYHAAGYNSGGIVPVDKSEYRENVSTKRYDVKATSNLLNSLYANFASAASIASTSITATHTAYNAVNHFDTLTLFDRNLNVIKEININGQVMNVIGKDSNGNMILIVQTYAVNAEVGPHTVLSVISLSPTLIMTTLFSKIVRTTNGDTVAATTSFSVQNPYFDKNLKEIVFLNFVNGLFLEKVKVDFENGSVTPLEFSADLSESIGDIHAINENFANAVKFHIGKVTKAGKEYMYIVPVIAGINEIYHHDSVYSASSTTYRTGAANMSLFGRTYINNEFPLRLFSVDSEGTVTLKDSIPLKDIVTDGLKSAFPVGDEFILLVKDSGMWLYGINESNERLMLVENISAPIKSMGVDSLERIWYVRDEDDYSLEMVSPFLSLDVRVTFEDPNLTYNNKDIETSVLVEAVNLAGSLQELEVKLIIEGNAMFRETQNKSITIVTNSLQPLRVPVVVTGSGSVNIYTAFNG
jgi:hypothetical protein